MYRETQAVSSTLRLWWRCTLCGWRVDTFGSDHAGDVDRTAMGWEVLDHLEAKRMASASLTPERPPKGSSRLAPSARANIMSWWPADPERTPSESDGAPEGRTRVTPDG